MKKIIYIIAVLLLLAAGYYTYIYWALGNDSESTVIVGENLEGEADPSRMTLTMTEWRWQHVLYKDGRKVAPMTPGKFTLTFTPDGKFSAKTDCNSMGGSYVAKDGSIAFGEIFMTKMFCEGSQEGEFAQLLTNSDNYQFTARGELILGLKSNGGSVVFR